MYMSFVGMQMFEREEAGRPNGSIIQLALISSTSVGEWKLQKTFNVPHVL